MTQIRPVQNVVFPEFERFIAVASGDAAWTEAELAARARSPWWNIKEAEAHVVLATFDEDGSGGSAEIDRAVELISGLLDSATREIAAQYVSGLLSEHWQEEFARRLAKAIATDLRDADSDKVPGLPHMPTRSDPPRTQRWPRLSAIAAACIIAAFGIGIVWITLSSRRNGPGTQMMASNQYEMVHPAAGGGLDVPGGIKASGQVIYCDDAFQYGHQFKTDYKYAWLIAIDDTRARVRQAAYNKDGMISIHDERVPGRRDARDYYKYFVVVFSNEKLFDDAAKTVEWTQLLDELQQVARKGGDPRGEKATVLVKKALTSSTPRNIGLFLDRYMHYAKQRPKVE